MKRSAGLRRFTAAFLASVTLFAFMPKATGENAVTAAAVEKNRDNTWLGVAGLSDPDVPADTVHKAFIAAMAGVFAEII